MEFDGMPDGFVNLQSKLRTIKNDVDHAFRALARVMQSDRLFRDAAGVLNQIQLFDQLVALVLPLSAIRIWIRPFLNLVSGERIRGVACACGILWLMDVASFRRYKPLLPPIEAE